MSQAIFAFDEDETWISPTPNLPPSPPKAPTPTPKQSPRQERDTGRGRASSASQYFGRQRRLNEESGSVTWVRVDGC